MRTITIQRQQKCPACGGAPKAVFTNNVWNDYIAVCENCGFSYCELGDFGDTPEEALYMWDFDVQVHGLNNSVAKEEENGESIYRCN